MARAGATALAWQQFEKARGTLNPEPAALTLEGRLLKDMARQETGARRAEMFVAAAAAYERAAALAPASYPLINAATLYHLSGRAEEATRLASATLALVEERPDEAETPYYRAATRAEALLLLGREGEARAALNEAVALAPKAIEDHASTIRQFVLILKAQGREAGWLDQHRPPRSLHYGGHMSFRAGCDSHRSLKEEIGRILDLERVGFGYGALAAGADIIIAETLVQHGAELHLVLPGGAEAFASVSVDPYGTEWRKRFDAVLSEAQTIRAVRPLQIPPDETMIGLADEVAIGVAVMNARRLESRAVQLLVVADSASRRARDAWAEAGWRQHLVTAPREDVLPEIARPPQRGSRLLALLAVAPPPEVQLGEWLDPLRAALAALPRPTVRPYLEAAHVVLAYETPLAAAEAAAALRGALPEVRIGGHYSATQTFHDPFAGGDRIGADAAAAATGALASTLPGTAYVTEDFAAALVASGPSAPRTEFIGELDPPDGEPPIGLHVLKS